MLKKGSHTGLKLGSNSHFYGRAAAEEVLADFLGALLRPERAGHANAAGMANGTPAQRPRCAAAAAANAAMDDMDRCGALVYKVGGRGEPSGGADLGREPT